MTSFLRSSLVLTLYCCSSILLLSPLVAAATEPASFLQDLQRLDQQLHQLLVEVRETVTPDKALRSRWQGRQQEVGQQLDALTSVAVDPITARKLDALRGLQHNLRLALTLHQRGETDSLARLRAQAPMPQPTHPRMTPSKMAPANDACSDAQLLELGQVVTGSLSAATQDGGSSCSLAGSRDVWFRYRAAQNGPVGFDSSGSNFDTVVSVHRVSGPDACPGSSSNEAACSDDSYGLQATAYANLNAGQEVLVRLSGFTPDAGGNYRLRVGTYPTIEGRISSEVDGSPINTRIELCNRDLGFHIESTFSNVATGAYQLGYPDDRFDAQDAYLHTYGAPSHVDELFDDVIRYQRDDRCGTEELGATLSLRAGEPLTDIDLELSPGGSLSGQVLNEDGTPASLVIVAVYYADGEIFQYATTRFDDGTYLVDGMPDGDYFLHAYRSEPFFATGVLYGGLPCPAGCDPLAGTPVPVVTGSETSDIDLVLPDGVHIRGRVTDRTGQPLAGVTVSTVRADLESQFNRSATTDGNGEYVLRNLPPWGYFVYAFANDYTSQLFDGIDCAFASCGTDRLRATILDLQPTGRHYPAVSQVDFELTPRGSIAGSAIQGRMTDIDGTPLIGRRINALNSDDFSISSVFTQEDGSYRLPTQVGDTYYLYTDSGRTHEDQVYGGATCPLYTEFFNEDRCDPLDAVPLVAQELPITGIDFQLVPHPTINGTVTDITGTPLMGVEVTASPLSVYDPFPQLTNLTSTDAQGRYALPVPAGEHYLQFSGGIHPQLLGAPPCDDLNAFSCSTDGATAVSVGNADVTGIDLEARALGTLRGRLLDSQGEAIRSGQLQLWSPVLDAVLHLAGPDSSGNFEIRDIKAGEYRLIARTDVWRSELFDGLPCLPDCPPLGQGTPVIFEGAVAPQTGFDFELETLGVLRPRVFDSVTGGELTFPDLQLWDATSGEQVEVQRGAFEGTYELIGILPGRYRLSASYRGHNGQIYGGAACNGACTEAPAGTVIEVELGDIVSGITLHLDPFGAISGEVVNVFTGQPTGQRISIFDTNGTLVATDSSSVQTGLYTTAALPAGDYYVGAGERTSAGLHVARFYPGIDCPNGLEREPCNGAPAGATLVKVRDRETTTNIDFVLTPLVTGLRGRVVEPARNVPLSGIRIDVWNASSGNHVAQVETNAGGNYEVELPPGGYFVSTHNETGRLDQVFDGVSCPDGSAWSGRCDPASGSAVQVGDAFFPQVNFGLAERGARQDTAPASRQPSPTHPGHAGASGGKTNASVRGAVRDQAGKPLPNIELLLHDYNGSVRATAFSQGDGSYALTALEPGLYLLSARSVPGEALYVSQFYDGVEDVRPRTDQFNYQFQGGTPLTVREDAHISGIDFRLRAGGVLTGHVLTDRNLTSGEYPVPSAQVRYQNADRSVRGRVDVAVDGFFATPVLPPGLYYLTAVDESFESQTYDRLPCPGLNGPFRPLTCDPNQGRAVRARGGETTGGIDFFLRPQGTVYGFLYDAVTGEPLAFHAVRLHQLGGATRTVVSNRVGRFVFDSLPDGTYFLTSWLVDSPLGGDFGYSNVLYNGLVCSDLCEPTKGTPLAVSAGIGQRIDLHLPYQPLRLFGSVRNAASGAPLADVRVEIYDLDGTLVDSLFTNEDGAYLLDLPSGSYHVVTSNDLGFVDQVYPNRDCTGSCNPALGTPLTLDFETGQRVDFGLRSVLAP